VEELGRPLLSASVPKGEDDYITSPAEIAEKYNHQLDLILNAGPMPNLPSTVIDFTLSPPQVVREGSGDIGVLNP
jgi:tRNA A37 threonylcarbamoyladenosine synthetase subunit TsaC/SUA5/YrdC